MDPNSLKALQGAAGAAGGGDKVYVEDVFGTHLYEGNDGTNTINNGIDLAGEGGLVWIKRRDGITEHVLTDTEREAGKLLYSDQSWEETTGTNGVNVFNNNGFSLTGTDGQNNGDGNDYVSWSFRKAPGFFDVVTYEGDGVAGKTIPHNLGSAPGMIIVKDLDADNWWVCYHRSMGNTKGMYLNDNGDETDNTFWHDTDPTSTEFTVGAITNNNADDHDYVAYIFAHDDERFGDDEDESIIKCGTYAGIGSGKVEVNIGFEPQWIMIKNSDSSSAYATWMIFDNMRGVAVGENDAALSANYDDAEGSTYNYAANYIDFTSTGFNVFAGNTPTCVSGKDFIYIAIRRGPMKTPTDATEVFAIDYGNGSTTIPTWDSGFPVDAATKITYGSSAAKLISARLMGAGYLQMSATSDQSNDSALSFDSNSGWGHTYTSAEISHMFRRAPGFFDVVCYDGTGSARTVSHNLGVVPEMMIVKKRNASDAWVAYHSATGNTGYTMIGTSGTYSPRPDYWNSTTPTATQFTVGSEDRVNESDDNFIAYLFATLPGISKVGSYTGTGNDIDVNCGFTSGARFVLIKRTDSTGDWYVWDSVRGIIAGDDPYLLINEDDAEVTNTDYIDPLTTGFTVTSSAPDALNVSSGDYIYLAIA